MQFYPQLYPFPVPKEDFKTKQKFKKILWPIFVPFIFHNPPWWPMYLFWGLNNSIICKCIFVYGFFWEGWANWLTPVSALLQMANPSTTFFFLLLQISSLSCWIFIISSNWWWLPVWKTHEGWGWNIDFSNIEEFYPKFQHWLLLVDFFNVKPTCFSSLCMTFRNVLGFFKKKEYMRKMCVKEQWAKKNIILTKQYALRL